MVCHYLKVGPLEKSLGNNDLESCRVLRNLINFAKIATTNPSSYIHHLNSNVEADRLQADIFELGKNLEQKKIAQEVKHIESQLKKSINIGKFLVEKN